MRVPDIRFVVDGNPTPWEPELVRFPTQTQQPTAVKRVTELRQRLPDAAISVERRGDLQRRPEPPPMFRYSIYVREGSMLVSDEGSPTGFSSTRIEKQTLFSRPFSEPERESVTAEIHRLFPGAQLTEVKV